MVHIFDVDNTVIKKTSSWYFAQEALKTGVIRFSQLRRLPLEWLRYKLGRPNFDFIENAVACLAGIEKTALEKVAHNCFEGRMKKAVYAGAAELIRKAFERGERVIFATSSFHIIIKPLECFFGIEDSVASSLEFAEGKTTGRTAGSSVFGVKKKAAVEEWLNKNGIPPAEAAFYSDSYTDLPLLEVCGRPVAVNPDWYLAREAKKRRWEIKRFRQTLR